MKPEITDFSILPDAQFVAKSAFVGVDTLDRLNGVMNPP